jgi:hypothetical protein
LREQRGRHLLDAGVVFLHRVVEEAAAGGDLVLEVGQFARQLLEVGIGLEVRIGLRQRDQFAERAAQLVFGGGHLRRSLRRHRSAPRLDHVVEGATLMRGVALHRLDQVRDQIVALLELHVDIGKRLVDALAQRDEAIVGGKRKKHEDDDDAENDPAGRHGKTLTTKITPRGSPHDVDTRLVGASQGLVQKTNRPIVRVPDAVQRTLALLRRAGTHQRRSLRGPRISSASRC